MFCGQCSWFYKLCTTAFFWPRSKRWELLFTSVCVKLSGQNNHLPEVPLQDSRVRLGIASAQDRQTTFIWASSVVLPKLSYNQLSNPVRSTGPLLIPAGSPGCLNYLRAGFVSTCMSLKQKTKGIRFKQGNLESVIGIFVGPEDKHATPSKDCSDCKQLRGVILLWSKLLRCRSPDVILST